MMKAPRKSIVLATLTVTAVFLMAVAGVANAQGGPSSGQGYRNRPELPTAPLTAAEIEALNNILQDEYHAEAVYAKVIADLGEVAPFVQIRQAEIQHGDAVERLFSRYNLQLPENQWAGAELPDFESIEAACVAGVEAERANAGLYDQALANTTRRDLTNVFTNLKTASLENHLPAFEACDPNAVPAGDGPHSRWNNASPNSSGQGWQNRPATPPRWNGSTGQRGPRN